uniref:Phosphofurin acidic cluster sorting protein 2 n=1 Tax=Ditylenchus dipsaci TaxID=166011 RepID=A0A915D5R2_9BILA
MDQVNKQAVVVPMRFYANWDVDRTSSSAIQRTLSMIFTRLVLTKTLSTDISLIIAVRMQGTRRRTLRSNDITISPSSLDIPLDISFTIQYCHFIKRKSNNLQILIQRRKKYKNRQIPGFKTLAVGHINLDEILQQGGSREVAVWDTTCLNKSGPTVKELHAGTIFIANCFTQVVEQDVHKWNKSSTSKGDSNVLMSEEENDDYSSPEDSDFEDFDRSARRPEKGQKKIKQKNIKQKVVALLRRFRIPDEEDNAAAATGSTTSSRVMPPTELELQEIFEELENISDSGPELEPDKMSIVSNPRPGIRPFFAEGSKTDALPAIEDQLHSDDSVDLVDSEEQEMSSEDNLKDSNFWIQQIPPLADLHSTEHNLFPLGFDSPNVPKDLSSLSAKEKMKHSSTINSMSSPANPPSTELGKRIISNKKSQDGAAVLLDLLSQADSQCVVPANIWLTSSADLPWLCRLDSSLLVNVRIFDCPCLTDVRTGIQAIIGRIQKFCNSNSASPTTTRIGVLGGDKLVSQVLRAYVDLLQNKTCQEWLNYLRFSLIVPPSSAIGRLLAQITDGGYSEILWKRLSQISSSNFDPAASSSLLSSSDHQEVDACLSSVAGNLILESQQRSVNLSVGEVMLQLESGMLFDPLTMDTEKDNSQIFVPFLSELHLGNLEESSSPLYYMKGSLDEGGNNNGNNASNNASPLPSSHSQSFPTFSAITGNLSPPVSPHSQKLVS